MGKNLRQMLWYRCAQKLIVACFKGFNPLMVIWLEGYIENTFISYLPDEECCMQMPELHQ